MNTPKQTPRLDERWIDNNAYHIVRILKRKGFETYLVGGCVRDLLLGKHPKDYDIATNASPNQIKQSISNSFIIGKRFRLVLVKRGTAQYEVSTFRRDPRPDENLEDLPGVDNIFGSPEEDAKRRDFTVNSLFYDPIEHSLRDFAGGLPDLNTGMVRMIGDPNVRLVEDPIRILRGIRLAHMIGFALDSDLKKAMSVHAEKLTTTALPRRREEFLKFLRLSDPSLAFLTSHDLGVLRYVSPTLQSLFEDASVLEDFLQNLRRLPEANFETPTGLFSGLMLCIYLAKNRDQQLTPVKAREFLEDPFYGPLMRDELGMFKSEQSVFAKSLQMLSLLKRRAEIEKRGERRRRAVTNSEGFRLALQLSQWAYLLNPVDQMFWEQQAENSDSHARPSMGPRRRKRKHPSSKSAGSHDTHPAQTEEPDDDEEMVSDPETDVQESSNSQS